MLVWCGAVRRGAVQYDAVRCRAVRCGAVNRSVLHLMTFDLMRLGCITLFVVVLSDNATPRGSNVWTTFGCQYAAETRRR